MKSECRTFVVYSSSFISSLFLSYSFSLSLTHSFSSYHLILQVILLFAYHISFRIHSLRYSLYHLEFGKIDFVDWLLYWLMQISFNPFFHWHSLEQLLDQSIYNSRIMIYSILIGILIPLYVFVTGIHQIKTIFTPVVYPAHLKKIRQGIVLN